jgi:hypothetical protein
MARRRQASDAELPSADFETMSTMANGRISPGSDDDDLEKVHQMLAYRSDSAGPRSHDRRSIAPR